jgi:hypothetical protein
MNRFVWDLEYPSPYLAPGVNQGRQSQLMGYTGGPLAVPGRYMARLMVGEWSQTQDFRVLKDPRSHATMADMREQFSLMLSLRDKITETQRAVWTVRSVRSQVEQVAGLMEGRGADVDSAAGDLTTRLTAIEQRLLQTRAGDPASDKPKLTSQWTWLYGMLAGSDHRPTNSAYARFNELSVELDGHLAELRSVLTADVTAFNRLVASHGGAPVMVPRLGRVEVSDGRREEE